MGFSLGGMLGGLASIPIVGDLIGAGAEHASAKNLQNDSQAHSFEMFKHQSKHDKDMFGLESDFNAREALKAYNREREFTRDMPSMQVEGLRAAGLNPLLAATGGFRPASGGMQQASAKASSNAKGSSGGSPPGARLAIGEVQKRFAEAGLYREKQETEKTLQDVNTAKAEADRARARQTGTVTDIAEPVAKLMQAIAGMLEQSNIDRQTSRNVWKWLTEQLPDKTKPLSKKQQVEMLQKAKRRFPQLQGVDNAKRKIFGDR